MTQVWALGLALLVNAAAADNDVVQSTPRGKVNWSARTLTVTGSGPPSLKAPNATVARLGAERQAKSDALQNFVMLLRGLPMGGGQSVAALMDKTPELRSQLESFGKNFKILDTRYFADGGVDITAELPLDGASVDVLFPPPQQPGAVTPAAFAPAAANDPNAPSAPVPAAAQEITGIIINARGLKLIPSLAPRLMDEGGQEVYTPSMVNREVLKQHGMASFMRSLDGAQRDPRVADKAMVVRAVRVVEDSAAVATDLALATADGKRLTELRPLLAQARVVIVID